MQDRFVQSIAQLPPLLAQALVPLLDKDFSGHFDAKQLEQLQRITGLSEEKLLLELLPVAAALSVPSISNFFVGAIAKGGSGDIYMGANLELPNDALGQTVHAEQSAVSHAWLKGEKKITDIIVNYSPCGHCRQFINELIDSSNVRIHLPQQQTQTLAYYLPYAFGPKDLQITTPLLAEQPVQLKLISEDPVILEAAHQAGKSYAPYSKSYAAVTIELEDGTLFSGRYAENAAFNPSMMPMQMALCDLIRHNQSYNAIKRAVLVESSAGKITLVHQTLSALRDICNVELEHVSLEIE
ncbi:MAG: cytidine deaminase [Parashewanella sp.]